MVHESRHNKAKCSIETVENGVDHFKASVKKTKYMIIIYDKFYINQ